MHLGVVASDPQAHEGRQEFEAVQRGATTEFRGKRPPPRPAGDEVIAAHAERACVDPNKGVGVACRQEVEADTGGGAGQQRSPEPEVGLYGGRQAYPASEPAFSHPLGATEASEEVAASGDHVGGVVQPADSRGKIGGRGQAVTEEAVNGGHPRQ